MKYIIDNRTTIDNRTLRERYNKLTNCVGHYCKEGIEKIANIVRDENIENLNNLENIVKSYGGCVKLYKGNESDCIELIVHNIKDFEIIMPNRLSLKKMRYRIAHCLGHYFTHIALNEDIIPCYSNYIECDDKHSLDYEAFIFACELLASQEEFVKKFDEGLNLEELANYFMIPNGVLDYRMEEVNKAKER